MHEGSRGQVVTLNVAHRGASTFAPENTMAAFEKAVELGADALELDVHLTRDGELVVIHDHAVDRTTDGRGPVHERTLEELRRLDAGRWFGEAFAGERIPTLHEVLDRFKGRLPLALELKGGSAFFPGIEERVVAALRRRAAVEQAVVASFDHHALRRVKELEPALRTGALLVGRPVSVPDIAAACRAEAVALEASLVTAVEVEACHAAGLQLVVWVVNDPAQMRRCIDLRVDAIITDRPDLLCTVLRQPG
jgi:glycerophosphoryl diester phosphodiesterase